MIKQFNNIKNAFQKLSSLRTYDKALLLIELALIALPILLGVLYIKKFGVNIIAWDQWQFVPLLEKFYTGNINIGDLFAQHNDHRIFFPRLIMIASAYITHYSSLAEMYISWSMVVATTIILFIAFKNQFKGIKYAMLGFIPISWMLFNFNQYQNILWGWQIPIYLCVLAFIASMYFLKSSKKFDVRYILSIGLAIISSFSFINGLLAWPAGLILIFLKREDTHLNTFIPWAIAGLLTWGAYFYQWSRPSGLPTIYYPLEHLDIALGYTLAIIGAPFAPVTNWAIILGIVALVLMAAVLAFVVKIKGYKENALWISLIFFSILSAMACMLGRSGFGVDQAMSSRYVTLILPGIIGLYALAIYLRSKMLKKHEYTAVYIMVVVLILIGIVTGYTSGYNQGKASMDSQVNSINLAKNYSVLDDNSKAMVFVDTKLVENDLDFFKKYKLNIYS